MKNIYLPLFFCILISCQNHLPKQNAEIATIDVYQNTDVQKIEDFLINVRVVALETTNSSLIQQIRKIETNGTDWFISDYNDSPIKRFSNQGHFINEIGRRGQGPGEYIQNIDFTVDNDTVNTFAWTPNRKWIRLQKDNTFLYQTDIKVPFSEIYPNQGNYLLQVDGGTFFHKENSSEKMNDYLYVVNKDFVLIKELQPKKYPYDMNYSVIHNHFSPGFDKNEVLYIREFNDTIYAITPSLEINPKYRMDFGELWYSQDFFEKYYDKNFIEIHTEFERKGYPKYIVVNENADYIVITYTRQEDDTSMGYVSFYDKVNKKSYNFKSENHPITKLLTNMQGYDGKSFYGYIPSAVFLDIVSKLDDNPLYRNLKEAAVNISEDDNPLLVFFQTKK